MTKARRKKKERKREKERKGENGGQDGMTFVGFFFSLKRIFIFPLFFLEK
jgi:hypothetical protein